uniref:Uncharacterized protein n=1 Tax=viral metagenome TaxID=1070528 RepID=A0A6C0J812_9ZZZZ
MPIITLSHIDMYSFIALFVPIKILLPILQFPEIFTPGLQVTKLPKVVSCPIVEFKFI